METLKEHRSRILVQPLDLTEVRVKDVVAGRLTFHDLLIKQYNQPEKAVPEREALWFYLRNHAVAVIERCHDVAEPLGKWAPVVGEYHEQLQLSAMRMFYYLLQICVREARHAHNSDKVTGDYPMLKSWYQGYKGGGSDGAVNALLHKTPDAKLGDLSQFLSDIFYKCQYGGGYGGKKWGQIADVLNQFVKGQITGEMMLDTAWTLSHNNGPIFNKGMWYSMYNGGAIAEILDVQRGGSIPQYIRDVTDNTKLSQNYQGRGYVEPAMRAYVDKLAELSTDFTGGMDWQKVQKLGAVKSYSTFINIQEKEKPKTPAELLAIKKAAEQAAKLKAEAAAAKLAEWTIQPGIVATTYKPARAKAA